MSDVKQVKVDNWGIYFLQRLKHFFNRTDYCDLTLQFQDNAQLKVHRLVLSACTEYFELLERTCEMYEDCLVMPDDLQADVVVPIVNFMYTGQLEFKFELLDSLYQTSQIMNMPVLTKLLDAHRFRGPPKPVLNYNTTKRSYSKITEVPNVKPKQSSTPIASSSSTTNKRSYSKAFGNVVGTPHKDKKLHHSTSSTSNKSVAVNNEIPRIQSPPPVNIAPKAHSSRKILSRDPRPSRYELPEELDTDNIFDDSFSNISYTSQPLMIHPESTKHYSSKRGGVFEGASSSKKFGGTSTVDIVECKKVMRKDHIFEDDDGMPEEAEIFQANMDIKEETKPSNQLFDQILDHPDGPKVTIETKDNKQAANIDHAKIISEVLKKYPHLVKSNKNIKLKILNTPSASNKFNKTLESGTNEKIKGETPDFTYETDVLDSKEAARLIALGAENIKGPWICLICGTPGRALHFTSYYKYRRHLVDVHNEKPVSKICEYCGLKSLKRNYLLHHLYTKHGVEPPASYHFPKCNLCNYVALTEGFLVKHKLTHSDVRNFRCNVCPSTYSTSNQLLAHIQSTGHKYSAERKMNLQCIYCLKVFLRESNLYTHLKTNHKQAAKSDGIIDESDEEKQEEPISKRESVPIKTNIIKYEPPSFDNDYDDMEGQYQIQEKPDGNIQIISKKHILSTTPTKQKILNTGLTATSASISTPKPSNSSYVYPHEMNIINKNHEEIVVIDNNEYIMRDNHLIPRKKIISSDEYIVPNMMESEPDNTLTSTSMEFNNIQDTLPDDSMPEEKVIIKKSANINQPIQIVVSNEEEYKALMNSNHSIIFDDGDTNKTLTVLSTPHSTTLNTTTIDLDNTQSNEMMIIPNNYPLNVSEALPANNSNIVVVYSHPVDDQNKQYQLLTSEGIGTQFVPSSAVITQNYEAITTSTPVMSAHVIQTQEAESWQNDVQENVQDDQPQITATTELQELATVSEAEISPIENATIDNLNELPEVSLTPHIPQGTIVDEKQIEDKSSEINNVTIDNSVDQVVEEVIQNVSATPMDIDNSIETTIENDKETLDRPDETLPQGDVNIVTSDIIEEHLVDESAIVEHGPELEEDAEETIEDAQISENETNEVEKDADNSCEQEEVAQIIPINKDEATLTKIGSEQIETLASEWSEEEDETAEQETNPNLNSSRECPENNTAAETDLEESIENIQQEMEKQVNETQKVDVGTEDSANSPQEDNLLEQQASKTNEAVEAPQEKISSLLNDWEDNDSQEGNDSTNVNEDEEPTKTNIKESDTSNEIAEAGVENQEQKKDDKIKSLVSDWDDDDEEENNKN